MPNPAQPFSGGAGSHAEVIRAIEPHVDAYLRALPPPHAAWQPSEYLPDFAGGDWQGHVGDLQARAAAIPDDLLVALVGDMVTEEALPSYSMALNQLVQDTEGTSPAPWARWLRGWTGEENRHGDLLNAYLRLSGRVDMHAVERTVHALLVSGFNPDAEQDPYALLVYTSFQERATRISHGNAGRLAERAGDAHLARICRVIAGDEARHETFYTRMMGHVLEADPQGGVLAFEAMLRRQISMPGRFMADGTDPELFDHFATVAQRIGVYTARDYAGIIAHLVRTWKIAGTSVSGEAARAQEKLCAAAERYARLADRVEARLATRAPVQFSWIHGRST